MCIVQLVTKCAMHREYYLARKSMEMATSLTVSKFYVVSSLQ